MLLQIGQLLSNVGTQTTSIAFPLLVLAVTHSPAKAGVVGFARSLPWVLFALPAGLAADRWSRRRLMILADGVRVLAIGTLAVTILLDRVVFWEVVVVAFVEGIGSALFFGAQPGALRAVGASASTPGGRGNRDGPAGCGAARGTAARRRALRDRPCSPLRRRHALVRVFDHLAPRDADTVPGGT